MYYIICNYFSGRKRKKLKKIAKIFQYLDENKIPYLVYETKYYKHPQEIAKEITTSNESGNIIIIGGDGTINEVVNGIKDLDKWNIGIIPSGSGNDYAKALNLISKDYLYCLKKILNGHVEKVDYIQVNNQRCLNVLGTGIDVEVLQNFEKHQKLKGKFRYLISLLQALLHIHWHEFDVSIDDGPFIHKKGFLITLCNGSFIGGGIPICPNASLFDHKLEFVFVGQIKKVKIINYLIKLLNGKVFSFKETEHIYCQKAIFKQKEKLTLQIDGNITNDCNEYICEIIKEGLKVYR